MEMVGNTPGSAGFAQRGIGVLGALESEKVPLNGSILCVNGVNGGLFPWGWGRFNVMMVVGVAGGSPSKYEVFYDER